VDAFHIGREALLDEVVWNDNGWPTINAGRGPSGTAAAPVSPAVRRAAQTEFFDGFTSTQLGASWQWPMANEQEARVDAASGFLTLAPVRPGSDNLTGAVLAERAGSGDYVATTLVDTRGMTANATAGLAAYSWRDNAAGVSVSRGQVFVWRRDGRDRQAGASVPAPGAPSVYLRMTVTNGEQFRFSFSPNGRDWKDLSPVVQAPNIEGAHVALTAGGAGARFDWVKITAK
jgi:beta-xylosidase